MNTLNFEEARHNMVVQQIQPWNVKDDRTLDLLSLVPREDFVPAEFKQSAFTDMAIPLGNGQEMLQPKMEAFIIQTLNINDKEKVLEIGTGSGYLTALMASQARHVITVDIHEQAIHSAKEKLDAHNITNVTYEVGDASCGWDLNKPYDVIVVTGSLHVLPESFQQTLNVGGRMIAFVGEAPAMEMIMITRESENEWSHKVILETSVPALINAVEPPNRFVL